MPQHGRPGKRVRPLARPIDPSRLLTGGKVITAILPKGRARPLVEALVEEHGIRTAVVHHARGVGRFSSIRRSGLGQQLEKEVLDVTVPSEDADRIFEYIFYKAGMNKPHSGILFMAPVPVATIMEVPALDELPDT